MAKFTRGKITIQDIKGRKAYFFMYTKKSGKPGRIEFFPETEEITNIFENQTEELEIQWQSGYDFTIMFQGKEIHNKKKLVDHNSTSSSVPVKIPGDIRLMPVNCSKILGDIEDKDQMYRINPGLLLNKVIWKYDKKFALPKDEKSGFFNFFESLELSEPVEMFRDKMHFLGLQMETQYGGQNIKTFRLPLHPQSRLIVGIGNSSPAETGILLHHIYGVPYIPGSALKGITRQAAVVEIAQNIREEKGFEDERIYQCFGFVDAVIEAEYSEKALRELRKQRGEAGRADIKHADLSGILSQTALKKNKETKKKDEYGDYRDFISESDSIKNQILLTREIFGSQSTRGSILFLDAYPEPGIRFNADIMNPHYPKYYNDASAPPGDWQDPLPIPFLTVEKGTFHFTLCNIKPPVNKESENPDMLSKTEEWLKTALKDFGVGAKTALGYGLFREKVLPHKERR